MLHAIHATIAAQPTRCPASAGDAGQAKIASQPAHRPPLRLALAVGETPRAQAATRASSVESSFELRASSFELRASSFELRASSFELRASSFERKNRAGNATSWRFPDLTDRASRSDRSPRIALPPPTDPRGSIEDAGSVHSGSTARCIDAELSEELSARERRPADMCATPPARRILRVVWTASVPRLGLVTTCAARGQGRDLPRGHGFPRCQPTRRSQLRGEGRREANSGQHEE